MREEKEGGREEASEGGRSERAWEEGKKQTQKRKKKTFCSQLGKKGIVGLRERLKGTLFDTIVDLVDLF